MTIDRDLLSRYTLTTWGYKQGEMVGLMIHLGVRLGIYQALDGAGPVTSGDLAAATGLHERWLREWLRSQAAAELLLTTDGETFEMEPEAALVLARVDQPTYAAAVFAGQRDPRVADGLVEAFRTGIGLTYDDQGEGSEQHTEAMLAPMARALLVSTVIPMLDGVADRLTAGARVVDVGCGTGLALELISAAFPDSTYEGYDVSERAVAAARQRFDGSDNVTIHLAGGEELPATADVDLVMTLDCLHDMPRPDLAMAAIRGGIADDGTWLVKEIKLKDSIRSPYPPFTTATLQMEANRKLNLSAGDTMRLAQRLYENGYITYMRTDSVHLSDEAITAARSRIVEIYGEEFLNPSPRRYRTKTKGAQEAHEAIRPAGKRMRTLSELELEGMERSLYDLIWKRAIATQMKPSLSRARLRIWLPSSSSPGAV
jgi:2-polyprenyl-3-methyl-5-hydroxy-6-metoxy-1,4-benzoquinol methylase